MKPSFAIIGCGKVGRAFARHLAKAGYRPAGFASRSPGSARAAAEAAGVPDHWFEKSWDAARGADIVLLTPPDGAIAAVCREIAENRGFSENTTVLHCSGALSSSELAAARQSGARIGSLHPLQSFATEKPGNPFADIMMAVEGDAGAVEIAGQMARDLKARPFTITTEGKILYHAAAVVASNYLVTLMGLAVDLMAASGVSKSDAFNILKPLIHGTLNNIEGVGIPDALTGPIARGDVAIVEKHVAAIGQLSAEMTNYYCQSGRQTIKIAQAKGTLSEPAARQLSGIFDSFGLEPSVFIKSIAEHGPVC